MSVLKFWIDRKNRPSPFRLWEKKRNRFINIKQKKIVTPKKKRRRVSKKKSGQTEGRWTQQEHNQFLNAYSQHGRDWVKVENKIPTRSAEQIRSHAQKYFIKVERHYDAKDDLHIEDLLRRVDETMQALIARHMHLTSILKCREKDCREAKCLLKSSTMPGMSETSRICLVR